MAAIDSAMDSAESFFLALEHSTQTEPSTSNKDVDVFNSTYAPASSQGYKRHRHANSMGITPISESESVEDDASTASDESRSDISAHPQRDRRKLIGYNKDPSEYPDHMSLTEYVRATLLWKMGASCFYQSEGRWKLLPQSLSRVRIVFCLIIEYDISIENQSSLYVQKSLEAMCVRTPFQGKKVRKRRRRDSRVVSCESCGHPIDAFPSDSSSFRFFEWAYLNADAV
eukprot:CAMPEP_0114525680 /NCGR_PEP_ID=MMETSP0109-20121206/22570_1 /TAXON_ID=29199 /ORGANISM="Chlorarachnion reptans, Strain CCCM449" /LENGTH=227 /DNA_ID=CAMNT_0001707311 /DNA_START=26 /DNA_END=709 /DNA_ORIENTATION=-